MQPRRGQRRVRLQRHADDCVVTRGHREDGVVGRAGADASDGRRRRRPAEDGAGIVRHSADRLHLRQRGSCLPRGSCRGRRRCHLYAGPPRHVRQRRPLAGRASRRHAGGGPHAKFAQDAEPLCGQACGAGRTDGARGLATTTCSRRYAGGTDTARAACTRSTAASRAANPDATARSGSTTTGAACACTTSAGPCTASARAACSSTA